VRPDQTNLYDILGVNSSATDDQIRVVFRKLALRHHPDKNHNSLESTAMFTIIHNAYVILTNPVSRGQYDAFLATSSVSRNASRPAHGESRKSAPRTSTSPTDDGHRPVLGGVGSLASVLGHLNCILWDCEDLIRSEPDWDRSIAGSSVGDYVSGLLVFIDTWVLEKTGYPDYFFAARGIQTAGQPHVPKTRSAETHRAYVNIADYFYDVRRRSDRLMNRATMGDLLARIPGTQVRIVDAILEAHNYGAHCLGIVRSEGAAGVPSSFCHSHDCFADGGQTS
jgi:curved DNA-binding protein CbpA